MKDFIEVQPINSDNKVIIAKKFIESVRVIGKNTVIKIHNEANITSEWTVTDTYASIKKQLKD